MDVKFCSISASFIRYNNNFVCFFFSEELEFSGKESELLYMGFLSTT